MSSSQLAFFSSKLFAVSGASADPSKFGNIILNHYLSNKYKVIPINPRGGKIQDLECATSIQEFIQLAKSKFNLEPNQLSLSIVTPPAISEKTIFAAIEAGIKNIWLQPGSEPSGYKEMAIKNNVSIIGGGPCVLVSSAM
ncbi:hypothetical protein BB561_003511 [Smittium simulii]|uniref:CoA-binding domain-containing protein n=1 Tax=Smittium simulii TaxID=133385 RepID=A0A2T9YKY3_9FUNG|nr:hypothetical protein BB561_003511 [Smittium simulii]